MQPDQAVRLKAVSKKYPLLKVKAENPEANLGDFWALNNISLEIERGRVLGIIGRNGAGKTTLLNIIAGTLSPTRGERIVHGRTLGLFNLGIGFQDELTGRENIFLNGAILGASRNELNNKLNSIIEFSELGDFVNMPLGTYSQGMRLRLGFSIIANLDFDILVIDEVLAVGDALFQDKCFQRLMEFKHCGKTLIITTQGMELINRLCEEAVLLDHGCLIFHGPAAVACERYHALSNTEKFFVGRKQGSAEVGLVTSTKKWAEDRSNWGQRLGTREVEITSVELLNKFGWPCKQAKTQQPLKIKVNFAVRNIVRNVHFGLAIFREDGVYCYGPNTRFDGYAIPELKPGRGHFVLEYEQLLLAPGKYRFSVAVWDEQETLAFAYHNGEYRVAVNGYDNTENALLNMPFRFTPKRFDHKPSPVLPLSDGSLKPEGPGLCWLRLLNAEGKEQRLFQTNESVRLVFGLDNLRLQNEELYLRIGIYREDGIFCQGITRPIGKNREFQLIFPQLAFLPGSYQISLGIWDNSSRKFLFSDPFSSGFKMVFSRQDHGTVYLRHKWRFALP